jgi:hypothetical protein
MQNELEAKISSLKKQLADKRIHYFPHDFQQKTLLDAAETQGQIQSSTVGLQTDGLEKTSDKDAYIADLKERVREAEDGARLHESIQIQDLQMEISLLQKVPHTKY